MTAKVAIYGGGGAPHHHAAVLSRHGHDVEFVFPVDVRSGALDGFDAFVIPGGGYRAMLGQLDPLGSQGAKAIADYVRGGGMYVGSCAGSYDAAVVPESFLRACPAQRDMCLLDARVWNSDDTEWLGLRSPGVGILQGENVASDHPVMAGMPDRFEITHYNGPLFTGARHLVRVESPTDRFTPAEHFLGGGTPDTLIGRAARAGVANVVAGSCGAGRVVLFGSHPEFGFSLAMDDERQPARMLVNAIEWQMAETGPAQRPRAEVFTDRFTSKCHPDQVGETTGRIRAQVASLRGRGTEQPWLASSYAMSVFGVAPATLWEMALGEIDRLLGDIDELAGRVDPRILAFRPPEEWKLDGGHHGVVALLRQAEDLIDQALRDWDIELGMPSANPYEFMLTSPFHLVAGSYLAAIGRIASAAQLCRTSVAATSRAWSER